MVVTPVPVVIRKTFLRKPVADPDAFYNVILVGVPTKVFYSVIPRPAQPVASDSPRRSGAYEGFKNQMRDLTRPPPVLSST
jgi:hypothetical protein